MTVRTRLAHGEADRCRCGGLLRPHLDADHATTRRSGPGRVRRRRPAPRGQPRRGRRRRKAPADARPGLHGPVRGRPRRRPPAAGTEVVLFGAGADGEPTAQDWAEACDTINYEIVTRIGGRMTAARRQSEPPHVSAEARMRQASPRSAAGVAAAGTAAGIARRRRVDRPAPRRRRSRRSARCGPGRSPSWPTTAYPCTSRSTSSPTGQARREATGHRRLRPRVRPEPRLLALPARRLPRPGPLGLLRPALARPLRPLHRRARDHRPARPRPASGPRRGRRRTGPVVLVGHSMGGMTIVALAEEYPELFGDRVVGVGADLDHGRRSRPQPDAAADAADRAWQRRLALRAVATLARGHRAVDGVRRAGRPSRRSPPTCSPSATRCRRRTSTSSTRCSRATPFEVVAEFFPSFGDARQVRAIQALGDGARPRSSAAPPDRLTSIGHSRKLHAADPRLPAARVRGRRPHGDPGAARPGQRRARPAARRRRRRSGSPAGDASSVRRSARSRPRGAAPWSGPPSRPARRSTRPPRR